MKAAIYYALGGPDVLKVENVPVPQIKANDEVLVHIIAASVNPVDWKLRQGKMMSPSLPCIPGCDFSGVVVRVGTDVHNVKAGDEVYAYGRHDGATAQYIVVQSSTLSKKPSNLTHQQAASLPVVALTTVQGFQKANIAANSGAKVLIHAGAGGVGSFAVQYAKALGCYVATTCSTANVEFVRGLGADLVIDRNTQKFDEIVKDYDMVFSTIPGETEDRSWKCLKKSGTLVAITADDSKVAKYGKLGVVPMFGEVAWNFVSGAIVGPSYSIFMCAALGSQLDLVRTLVEAGKIKPIVSKVYQLTEIAAAHTESESGKTRGKLVVTLPPLSA